MAQTITTKVDAMAAQIANVQPLTHKEMAAHIRRRIKHEGIKARVQMQEFCGFLWIKIFGVTFEQQFSEDEQRKIRTMAVVNGLTLSQGMPIDVEQMTNGKGFSFLFHGSS